MNSIITCILTALLLIISTVVSASVVINGTRVVMDGVTNEATITLHNPDNTSYLIQSWVEKDRGSSGKTPFVVTPPIFRIDSMQKNTIRIVLTEKNLPDNMESLFWLNIKSIPPLDTGANNASLVFTIKSVLKLIYRPLLIRDENTESIPEKLNWKFVDNGVMVTNPTPFVINLNSVKIDGKELDLELASAGIILPYKTITLPIKKSENTSFVEFNIVNDFGGVSKPYNKEII